MVSHPLISVAVITNGESPLLQLTAAQWQAEGFIQGETIFFCGPSAKLAAKGIPCSAIIDYVDPPYYRHNFHINHKKKTACDAIDADYIFLVHDRFAPKPGLLRELKGALADRSLDFGAVNVDNEDGTAALRPLRLKLNAYNLPLLQALEPLGRLVCDEGDTSASTQAAINGGQFFLRKALSGHLERPMRWVEMEDDILSHDLRTARGQWIENARLVTLIPRRAPSSPVPGRGTIKNWAYRACCNSIAWVLKEVSAGRFVSEEKLHRLLSEEVLLIDPLHKMTASDVLPTSLEKIMTRARIASRGSAWSKVERHYLGWKLTGTHEK